MRAKLRLSIQKDGKHVYGDGRQALLLAVEQLGSLNKAAASLNMSYRGAWGKLKTSEGRLGYKLLNRRVGGRGGGGASLTPEAKDLIIKYQKFRRRAEEAVEREFATVFSA